MTTDAVAGPRPNTVCVARSQRSQSRQPAAAWRRAAGRPRGRRRRAVRRTGRPGPRRRARAGRDRPGPRLPNERGEALQWRPSAGGKRRLHNKPSWSQVGACLHWLEAELAAVGPRLVVCLGATAAQALLGKDFRMTRERGHVLERPPGHRSSRPSIRRRSSARTRSSPGSSPTCASPPPCCPTSPCASTSNR